LPVCYLRLITNPERLCYNASMPQSVHPLLVVGVVAFLFVSLRYLIRGASRWSTLVQAYETGQDPAITHTDNEFLAGPVRCKAYLAALPEGAYIRLESFKPVLIPWSDLELDGDSLGARVSMVVPSKEVKFKWAWRFHQHEIDEFEEQPTRQHLLRSNRL
jgi:hypothetical protein